MSHSGLEIVEVLRGLTEEPNGSLFHELSPFRLICSGDKETRRAVITGCLATKIISVMSAVHDEPYPAVFLIAI